MLSGFKKILRRETMSRPLSVHTDIRAIDRLLRFTPAIGPKSKKKIPVDTEGMPVHDVSPEGDGDPDPEYRLGKYLLNMGKVNYRHEESMTPRFRSKQQEICRNKNSSQLRRCLKPWMLKSNHDVQMKYKSRRLGWYTSVGDNAAAVVPPVVYGTDECLAYAHYIMPGRYSITKRLFREINMILPNYSPSRILDFGCGPATAGMAAMDVWRSDVRKYIGIDNSAAMVDAAKIAMHGSGVHYSFHDKVVEVVKNANDLKARYDLVVASYTLSELNSDPARIAATQLLFEMLDVGGVLLLLENGDAKGSHTIRSSRQFILDTYNSSTKPIDAVRQQSNNQNRKMVGCHNSHHKAAINKVLAAPDGNTHECMGASVVAPCTHDNLCPLAGGESCHFSQKVYSGIMHKGQEEKFSYVVLRRTHATERVSDSWNVTSDNSPENTDMFPMDQPAPTTVLQRFMDTKASNQPALVNDLLDEVDWLEYDPAKVRTQWKRVIKAPYKQSDDVMKMEVCTSKGGIATEVVHKDQFPPLLHSYLHATTIGGLFPALHNRADIRYHDGVTAEDIRGSSKTASSRRKPTEAEVEDPSSLMNYDSQGSRASQAEQAGGMTSGRGRIGRRPVSRRRLCTMTGGGGGELGDKSAEGAWDDVTEEDLLAASRHIDEDDWDVEGLLKELGYDDESDGYDEQYDEDVEEEDCDIDDEMSSGDMAAYRNNTDRHEVAMDAFDIHEQQLNNKKALKAKECVDVKEVKRSSDSSGRVTRSRSVRAGSKAQPSPPSPLPSHANAIDVPGRDVEKYLEEEFETMKSSNSGEMSMEDVQRMLALLDANPKDSQSLKRLEKELMKANSSSSRSSNGPVVRKVGSVGRLRRSLRKAAPN